LDSVNNIVTPAVDRRKHEAATDGNGRQREALRISCHDHEPYVRKKMLMWTFSNMASYDLDRLLKKSRFSGGKPF
jgi:hypothetical protein